jgi:serine/threonine-protein kinase
MAAFGEDQIGRVLGGRYRLIAPVGTGASATVYVADDVQLGRRVALKVLHPTLAEDPAFLKRFRAEAQASAALSHPNIMAVYDWGMDEEGSVPTPYLVVEYLSSGSLRAMLDRGRTLSPSQALLVGLEAARGLDYAHRRGLVHRDVKPANLLFGEDGRLRIADFGLARAIAEAAWTEPAGVVLGTARYASPEQAKGQSVDGKTDVYSLTLTLIESVTGHVPFASDTTVATLMNRLDKLMPVSAELGPLAPVLEKAGRPDPAERSDAGELARSLVQAAERLPRPTPLPLVPALTPAHADDTVMPPPAAAAAMDATLVAARSGGSTVVAPPVGRGGVAIAEAPHTGDSDGGPQPSGKIYDVEADKPRRRMRSYFVAMGALVVAALIAVGIYAVTRPNSPSYAVPNLVGLPLATAQNEISENGWNVNVLRQRSDSQAFDAVYDQSPKNGTLKQGAPLTLYVSDGPVLHTLADLNGKTQTAAEALLAKSKLKMNASNEFSETVPKGVVLRWSVGGTAAPVGQQVPTGTAVSAVVSAGPAPRTIPSLLGHNVIELKNFLTKSQLVAQRQADQYSDTVPLGGVITIAPAPGAQVPRGSTVQFSVSKGPDTVPMPDLRNQTLAQATQTLAAQQLKVGVVAPVSTPTAVVVASDPPAGIMIKRGSSVNLLVH